MPRPIIESVRNPAVKAWRALQSRRGREEAGRFLIEGAHLVEEALRHRPECVREILVAGECPLPASASRVEIVSVSRAVLGAVCEAKHPQPIAAVCAWERDVAFEPEAGRYLLLDDVRDPGNVGTLIRTADAAGLDGVVLGPTSADPHNPKTLRATQGSLFHLPVYTLDLPAAIERLRERGVPILAAASHDGRDYRDLGPDVYALIVGNESRGITPEITALADECVTVPLPGKAESLSVATAAAVVVFGWMD